jgi:hypothetical protein
VRNSMLERIEQKLGDFGRVICHAINQNIPDSWSSYVTQVNLGLEVVPAHLYDTLTITSGAGTTPELRFFQQTNVALDISNMKQAGMLSNPEAFLIQTIRVFFKVPAQIIAASAPGAFTGLLNDIVLAGNTAIGELSIGNKKYGPWPIWTLPASTFVKGFVSSAGATAANVAVAYAQLDGPMYPLFPNLMLSPLQSFVFSYRFPSGSPALSANLVTEVVFDGQLARSIQ